MGRLTLLKFYCCGAMDRVAGRGADWRNDISSWLISKNAIPLNPLDKPIAVGLEDDNSLNIRQNAKITGDYASLSKQMKLIRSVDLRMVDSCDCVIANINLDHKPCGTWEEIFWANRAKKPIIIYAANGIKELPDWIFGSLPYQLFFENWDDIKKYLTHIDIDDKIDCLDRWRFFNMQDIIERIVGNIHR